MRLLLSLSIGLFMLSSCNTYYSYAALESEQMTPFEFAPRQGDLEVFFLGESKPIRNYLRIGLVKENRTAYDSNLGELIKHLENKALAMGADAMIVMGSGDAEMVYTDSCDDTYSVPRESMWGIAIKYVDEIDYKDDILARMEVVPLAESEGAAGGDIIFGMDGELMERIPNPLVQNVYLHSLEYLLYSTKGWVFGESYDPDYGHQSYLLRQHKTPLGIKANLRVKMRSSGTPSQIKILSLDGRLISVNMNLFSDKEGNIVRREWTQPDRTEVVATRQYTADGVCSQEIIEMKKKGTERFVPFVAINYKYLSEEEFRGQLNKEQIVKVSP